MSFLELAVILLAVAVIAVPLASRSKLGSVIGYLAAGAAIGPSGFGVVTEVESILHFSELGIVFLLFIIGLELQPGRLWVMRRAILGLGATQFFASTILLFIIARMAGADTQTALLIAAVLSLSSTAFALQVMSERGEITTRHGRSAFSILLFQDIAAIPLLAAVPLLASGARDDAEISTIGILIAIAAVIAVGLGGRFLLRPIFRIAASTGLRELFVAVALLTVLGTGLLMEEVGMSMALGAFLAGVALADSEYRHQLEADIDPFKGLLLGLFFMAVGMAADFRLVATDFTGILFLVIALITVKLLVLFIIARVAGHDNDAASRMAVSIAPGGEFAFVVFTAAVAAGVFEQSLADRLIVAVTLSMIATPVLFLVRDTIARGLSKISDDEPYDVPKTANRVIIAGFGRYGQIVGRLLRARGIPFTALESDAAQVDFVRKFGGRIYYGDVTRLDLLRAAHAETASVFVLAVEDVETSIKAAALVRSHFPELLIFARARNRPHAHRLMDLGVHYVHRETFASSLETGHGVLRELGLSEREAGRTIEMFREHDETRLREDHAHSGDTELLMRRAREWTAELERLFEEDAEQDTET